MHIAVTPQHIGEESQFVEDLRASVAELRSDPGAYAHGMAPVYGQAAAMPERGSVAELLTVWQGVQLDLKK